MGASKLHTEILNAVAADVVPAWKDISNARQVAIVITIVGTVTVTLLLDPIGDGSHVITLGTFTESAYKVLDPAIGRIHAASSGAQEASSAIVDLFEVQ